ncbi:SusC/RagA family TonB-linked outer membrane protein [Sphingobacterium gobiense]|uniref:SusC/RagA family TonB-linked outer membrane protein n=1 Tax=Sphingobacterium gobiense TaxID=1382456 RepID=A0A2S9JG52_9SPHI|nr:SusC/RagA family TonB-linked outer membrane protein [Sphingobacterium gobiense]PRD51934.1 SusC/RagA family TonB-linked outer membrane protein [Sphingobacterium gobiense]
MKKRNIVKTFRLAIGGLALFVAANAWAQSGGQLRGTIMDHTGATIPGATVQLLDANGKPVAHVSTDAKGMFTLGGMHTDGKYRIKVSMLGYEPYETAAKQVKEGESNSMLIRLSEESSELNEIVVVGYGQQRRGDLTTAVSSLPNVDTQVNRPVTNLGDMMQGNVAGVTVMSAGGDPSQNPKVLIRGMNTLNDNEPLYVVDGMPYYGGPINPNDIESMDILKDAAAAAIYGAQASSGVIVITTKKGVAGAPKLNVDLYRGWQTANNLPSALNAQQYAQTYNTAYANDELNLLPAHDPEQNPWGQVTRTNWMDEIFQTGDILNANVQLSGGSEKAAYSSSFGYHDKEGLLLNTGYKRFAYRLKSEFNFADRVTVGQNFYLNHTAALGTNTESSYSGSIINAIYMNPAAPVYDENGLFHGTVPFDLSGFSSAYGDTYNPVALLLRPSVNNPTVDVNGNAFASVNMLDGLTFKSNFGINLRRYSYKRFDPKIPEIGRTNGNNYLTHEEQRENRWIWDQQLNYTRNFGSHNLDAVAVYSAQKARYEQFYIQARGFEREEGWNQYIGNAAEIPELPTSDVWEDVLTSAIARVNYNYDNRYYVGASIRHDRTSRLSEENRSDVFPSVSAAWKISSEPFFDSSIINDLKLRVSWGQIGNIRSVEKYAYNIPLTTGVSTPLGSDNTLVRHYARTKQFNPDIVWERSESFDVGLDMMVFNKLSIVADYYRKTTIGMIQENDANPHVGVESGPTANVGDVRNEGFEIGARYNDQFGDWQIGFNANVGFNKNELLNLDGYFNDFIAHPSHVRGVLLPYRSTTGQPLYSYYMIPTAGLFGSDAEAEAYKNSSGERLQSNAKGGDLKFVDTNGDGVTSDADRVYMGSAIPKFTYGFSANVAYKNFDLSMLTYGVSGTKIFNGYKYTAFNTGLQGYNLDSRVLDAWTPENTDTDIPRLTRNDPNGNFGKVSDWYLENGDYFRIKNITIGYRVPSLLGKLQTRVYFSAENPFTFTSYSGIDPEVGDIGLDVGRYPLAKTFTVGLNVNF